MVNFLTSTEFRSKLFPDVTVKLRVVTVGRRIEWYRAQSQYNGDVEWRRDSRALWNTLVADFEGIELDGKKPTVDDLFLNGPEELVTEITKELVRMASTLGVNDASDEATIELAERQIAEARARIEARKNSEPQSSGPIPEAAIRTAADAMAIQTRPAQSGNDGTAAALQGT